MKLLEYSEKIIIFNAKINQFHPVIDLNNRWSMRPHMLEKVSLRLKNILKRPVRMPLKQCKLNSKNISTSRFLVMILFCFVLLLLIVRCLFDRLLPFVVYPSIDYIKKRLKNS